MSVGCVPIGSSSVCGVNRHPQERTLICSHLSPEDVFIGGMGTLLMVCVARQSSLILGGLINMLDEHFSGGWISI